MARSSISRKGAAEFAASAPVVDNVSRRILLTDPTGEAAEAIRVLRTRIQSQHLQLGRRALAVCGPTPEVGASFIAVNLAIALSQIGVKTLLIDGDLRTPSIHTYFAPALTGDGLYECLRSDADSVAEFTDENVMPNLDILCAGHPDSTGHELLAGEGFPVLINSCLRDYDMTIIDTPPANSCADGLRVSTVTGFSLIVARKNHTLVSDIRVLADQLKKERAHAVGTVMNDF